MNALISSNLDQLKGLCKRHRVKALYVFGSATRDDFDPAGSDLDFVVEFLPQQRRGFGDVYFQLVDDLKALFGCDVDLLEREPLEKSTNHIRRESILSSMERLYAA